MTNSSVDSVRALSALASAEGLDRAPRPCTYSNKCLVNFVENPLGCYDETRFDSREDMLREIMSVFEEPAFAEEPS